MCCCSRTCDLRSDSSAGAPGRQAANYDQRAAHQEASKRMIKPVIVALLAAGALAACSGSYQGPETPSVQLAESSGVAAKTPVATSQAVEDVPVVAPPAREDYAPLLREALAALDRNDHEAAMLSYERVLARAEDPRDQVRALISLAMLRMLPSSSVVDMEAATIVMEELDRRIQAHDLRAEFFGEIDLLRLLRDKDARRRALEGANEKLRGDLAAKDDLIRQLRALTVEGD